MVFKFLKLLDNYVDPALSYRDPETTLTELFDLESICEYTQAEDKLEEQ